MKSFFFLFILGMSLWFILPSNSIGCTNLLVTKGASKDGSVILTYTCDGEFHPILKQHPAVDYQPGDSLVMRDWSGKIRGKIAQVAHTYSYVSLINEHQLVICETTFSGREELINPQGLLHYWDLMQLGLQRAKTAREAIAVITNLVAEYGYRSSGESISIADTEEAWILEIIGPGFGSKGAQWVAVKVPDGFISAHANKARIGTFPLDDPENCLYSANVISFAVEKGYFNPASGEPFRFNEAYCPSTPKNLRYAETRVWSLFRRAAPSLNLSSDYHRAVPGAKRYPLFVKPDKKLSVQDVFSLMRDHYEGTDFDMTKGVDAGPFGSPTRWRPMNWKVDSVEYAWERPISTQQTGFSLVSQSRSWLPREIGGLLWYGVDDTYTSCYFPLYGSVDSLPKPFTIGNLNQFNWNSAWWAFNLVANFANLRYSAMLPIIQSVQKELEGTMLSDQREIEKKALQIFKTEPQGAKKYLTEYSVSQGNKVYQRWHKLGIQLISKFNDGYVQDKNGRPRETGYSEGWLRRVVKERPEQFKLPQMNPAIPQSKLVD